MALKRSWVRPPSAPPGLSRRRGVWLFSPPLEGGARGFESHRLDQFTRREAHMDEHSPDKGKEVGSNPTPPTRFMKHGLLEVVPAVERC